MSEQLQAMFHLTDKPIISKKPSELKEHPLNQTLFGDLKQSDYQELKEDIGKRGIQDPLHITKDNVIVSGHQRRKIALDLGINVPCIIRNDLTEEWQIKEQLIIDNLLRRHLDDYKRVLCDEELKDIEDIKAKLRKLSTLKRGDTLPDTQDFGERSGDKHSGESLHKRAEKLGTNRETLRQARKVYHEAPHDLKQKWQRNQISTHAAYRILQNKKRMEQRKQPTETPEFPDTTYDVLYADPPWRYEFATSISREIEQNYPTMTIDEMKELDLPVNGNAVLYMWATSTLLPKAIELMNAWGFEYKTHAVWDKEKIGMGFWFRGQHELLLVGTKGTFSPPETNKRVQHWLGHDNQKTTDTYIQLAEAYLQTAPYDWFKRVLKTQHKHVWGKHVKTDGYLKKTVCEPNYKENEVTDPQGFSTRQQEKNESVSNPSLSFFFFFIRYSDKGTQYNKNNFFHDLPPCNKKFLSIVFVPNEQNVSLSHSLPSTKHMSNTDTSLKDNILSHHLMVSFFSEVSDYNLVEEPCDFFIWDCSKESFCWDPQLLPPPSFAYSFILLNNIKLGLFNYRKQVLQKCYMLHQKKSKGGCNTFSPITYKVFGDCANQ